MAGLEQHAPGQGVDLSMREVEPSSAQRIAAEIKAGLRCEGCKQRVEVGIEFITMRFYSARGQFAAHKEHAVACQREGCDFRVQAGRQAHLMRPVSNRWLPSSAMAPEMRPSAIDAAVFELVRAAGGNATAPSLVDEVEERYRPHLEISLHRLVADGRVKPVEHGEGEHATFEEIPDSDPVPVLAHLDEMGETDGGE
jgi:hypothetical protein